MVSRTPSSAMGRAPMTGPTGPAVLAVLLSFPVAMALATGTEAPSTAIGQLGQLGADDRRRFARGTLVLTLVIVAALTVAITALAVRLTSGSRARLHPDRRRRPRRGGQRRGLRAVPSRQRAAAAGRRELVASRPGPGCSRRCRDTPQRRRGDPAAGLGTANSHHTPYWSVLVYLAVSAASCSPPAATSRSSSCSTRLRYSSASSPASPRWRGSRFATAAGLAAINLAGAVAVAFTLVVNLAAATPCSPSRPCSRCEPCTPMGRSRAGPRESTRSSGWPRRSADGSPTGRDVRRSAILGGRCQPPRDAYRDLIAVMGADHPLNAPSEPSPSQPATPSTRRPCLLWHPS